MLLKISNHTIRTCFNIGLCEYRSWCESKFADASAFNMELYNLLTESTIASMIAAH